MTPFGIIWITNGVILEAPCIVVRKYFDFVLNIHRITHSNALHPKYLKWSRYTTLYSIQRLNTTLQVLQPQTCRNKYCNLKIILFLQIIFGKINEQLLSVKC